MNAKRKILTAVFFLALIIFFVSSSIILPHVEKISTLDLMSEGALFLIKLLTFIIFQYFRGKPQTYYFVSIGFILISFASGIDVADEFFNFSPVFDEHADDVLNLLGFSSLLIGAIKVINHTQDAFKILETEAHIDHLTGIKNRSAIESILAAMHESRRNENLGYTIIMIDIDYFKKVNDTFGHAVGDTTLQKVSAIIDSELRDSDSVGRYGGEEFIVILAEENMEISYSIAERIRSSVEQKTLNDTPQITVSIGVSLCDPSKMESTEAVFHADKSLYKAKEQGRNRVVVHKDEE